MEQNYDLIIIGAGPTGLMAAKTAAEKGLRVVLIERRKDISNIRRVCCAHLILDDDYENEEIKLKDGKIKFTKNEFEVNYKGPTFDIIHKNFYSPNGSKIHFSHSDGRPFAIKIDKGMLLQGLFEECRNLGVEFLMESVAYDAYETNDGIAVKITKKGVRSTIKGAKIIEAGGVNAHITGSFGMNNERSLFATAHCAKYYIEGKREYDPDEYSFYYGTPFHSNAAIILDPSLYGDKIFEVVVLGSQHQPPLEVFEKVKDDSPLTHLFEDSKIIDVQVCTVKAFSPLKTPFKGNILSAGDAAAYAEVEIQGGLMCGYNAANAVFKEFSSGNGFEEYTEWWQKSFEFNGDDFLQVAQGYALVPFYTDNELDYLFALTEDEVLEGTNSQYKTPKLLWKSILRHKEKIEKERPEAYEKIKKIDTMSLSTTF